MMTHHDFIDLGPFLDPKKDVDEEKIDLSKSQLTYSPGRTQIHFLKTINIHRSQKKYTKFCPFMATRMAETVFWEGYWVPLGSEEP